MATWIKADGSRFPLQVIERQDKTALEVLQEAVGGWIEAVYFPEKQQVLFINEEGWLHNLDENHEATVLCRGRVRMVNGYIHGNAVLCSYDEAGMNDVEDDEEADDDEDDEEKIDNSFAYLECYYRDSQFCEGAIWECKTCHTQYCESHWHETSAGKNVECVACEYERLKREREE